MADVVLQADAITAGYNRVAAIRDFSLTVERGEVIALLGPNGAGKTTSLLSMVGLIDLMGGSVTALGREVTSRRTTSLVRAGLMLVPDDRGVFADLTVREHFRMARAKPSKTREQFVLDRFPALRNLQSRKAGLLSGGEQQMLAIGKALLAEPKILLIDEMSLGLAPIIVQEMLPGIRDLAKDEGIAVVLVEQHVALALSVSDRAIVLNHGRIVLEGSAAQLLKEQGRVESAYFGANEFADTAHESLPA
ncbi:amino acid/amide ABC transporter ATP-binding protein 2 (HAAT family) [Jatrophihabitans sp. GAS493]|uniref:ABC transporter ATP-binding protein n=1 Tax=Jatrophihabitans sp. GAS493 TaxID=1907575 RepID=UPI000BB92DD7|nr:ABC transporter ATP-binding protein [Jatrophihabitans sp. GAS493]SOD74623.1 amino acid/amide ABC transporter ATP-binding protein 2 (HAAT family) [Jatrophihabitans sp. GAS493]